MAFVARPKQFIFMAKKNGLKIYYFWLVIRMCGAFPIDRENLVMPLNTLSICCEKAIAHLSCFQVVAAILQMLRVA